MIRRWTRRRARVGAAVAASARWRAERDAVRAAYRVGSLRAGLASRWHSRTYRAALDREERAAKTYAGLMSRVGAVADTDLVLARQLAWKHSLPEAW
jgi:hypothetical protein